MRKIILALFVLMLVAVGLSANTRHPPGALDAPASAATGEAIAAAVGISGVPDTVLPQSTAVAESLPGPYITEEGFPQNAVGQSSQSENNYLTDDTGRVSIRKTEYFMAGYTNAAMPGTEFYLLC